MKYELYEVGGRVRDKLLGLPSNDVDYSVVIVDTLMEKIEDTFHSFAQQLELEGYEIYVKTPECFTIRARFPKNHKHSGLTADFVLARKENSYIKGTRKPNSELGTLRDDLERRDFTVNAMAESVNGDIIDPFGGQKDLILRTLRTPKDTASSFNDDPLRILRAMRFAITKGLNFSGDIVTAIRLFQEEKMDVVSTERIRGELEKMFKHNTSLSFRYMRWLEDMNPLLFHNIFREGLWFLPTTKK